MRIRGKEDIKKTQTAYLEMKTKLFEIKIIIVRIKVWLDTKEENIIKLEGIVIGTILNEEEWEEVRKREGERTKTNKQALTELWDNLLVPNTHGIIVSEGEKMEQKIF